MSSPGTCKHCHKRIFVTFPYAMKIALRTTKRTGEVIRVYPCPRHNGWHHTSKPLWKEVK